MRLILKIVSLNLLMQAKRWLLLATLLAMVPFGSVWATAKCLYVSSYHPGYEWNDGIERGLETVLRGQCKLDHFYMDTKRNTDPQHAQDKALEAKRYIETTKPDVVIAGDDNASKYLVKPYLKDTAIPIVFCGVNWTVEAYGYPYSNATGMIEVAPIRPLLKEIQGIIRSPRKGLYLSSDVYTEHKDYERYRAIYAEEDVELKSVFVKSLEDWKKKYLDAQSQQFDFIILGNNAGINDWNVEEAQRFALTYARILSVTNYDWMMPYSMLAMTKIPEEQGEWAGKVALSILRGTPTANIPIVVNRHWQLYLNPVLTRQAGIQIPKPLVHKAIKIGND